MTLAVAGLLVTSARGAAADEPAPTAPAPAASPADPAPAAPPASPSTEAAPAAPPASPSTEAAPPAPPAAGVAGEEPPPAAEFVMPEQPAAPDPRPAAGTPAPSDVTPLPAQPPVQPGPRAVEPPRNAFAPLAASPSTRDAPPPAPPEDPVRWFGVGLRVGVSSMRLAADQVPFLQSQVQDTLKQANASLVKAQAAELGSSTTVRQYTTTDLSLNTSTLALTPTFHLGGDGYFFKLETPVGLSRQLQSFGLGLYPLNYGHYFAGARLFPYVSAGLAASYVRAQLTSSFANDTTTLAAEGVVVQAGRAALGLKYRPAHATSIVAEIGYTPFALGGVVNSDRVSHLSDTIVSTRGPVDAGVRGGAGSMLDASVGLEWF